MNLRLGGQEKYQAAFYVYEELAATDQSGSLSSAVGQAVSEMLLGRYEESQGALEGVMSKEGPNAEAVANAVVLAAVMGRREDAKTLEGKLGSVDSEHVLLRECREKGELFDEAAKKYSAKVATAA